MSRHNYPNINNNIYSIKEGGLSFIVKVPKSKYSIEKFENNIKAKTLLNLDFTVIETEFGPGIKRNFITGTSGKQIFNILEQNESALRSLAKSLKAIHLITEDSFGEDLLYNKQNLSLSDVTLKRLEKLCEIHSNLNFFSKSELNVIKEELKKEIKTLKLSHSSFTHFDLHEDNLIWDGEKIHLIDFENSRYYDPLWDLLLVRENLLLTDEQWKKFLKFYFNGKSLNLNQEKRLNIYKRLNILRNLPYME